ncbi:MAG: hypothetical protein LBE08_07270 [Bifidobacteriaceae bacterium]|jgi:DNA polymerase-3 subunit epsilon|nr:hypothetical protein [Bifidobacteriaceae bacterium]
MLNFAAIDFETATTDRGSACAVGLARVREGRVVERWHWLCQPPTGPEIDQINQRIHGISPADLVGAPSFAAVAGEVWGMIGLDVVAAHGASFDQSVWEASWRLSGFAPPKFEWVDTVKLARSVLGEGNASLPDAAAALGVPFVGRHHNAADDAETCALVLVALAARAGAETVDDLRAAHGGLSAQPEARVGSDAQRKAAQNWHQNRKKDKPKDVDWTQVRSGEWLKGHVFVFTGFLNAVATPDAETLVARFGAEVGQNVTKKTTVLVVGDWDGPPTKKRQRADELIAAGQQISVVDESQFLGSIGATDEELALLAKDR